MEGPIARFNPPTERSIGGLPTNSTLKPGLNPMSKPFAILTCGALLLMAAAPETGVQTLFDGKTLNGWKPMNTRENFFVRDGVLVMNKGAGWLASDKPYRDFELRLTYRFVTPGADSGVFIRASLEGKNWTSRGYQVQNMDNQTLGKIVGMGIPRPHGTNDEEAARRAKKPAGEWNKLVIHAKGKAGRVTLNDTEVAASDQLDLEEGHIGLQAEGGVLEFKSIEIKPL